MGLSLVEVLAQSSDAILAPDGATNYIDGNYSITDTGVEAYINRSFSTPGRINDLAEYEQ